MKFIGGVSTSHTVAFWLGVLCILGGVGCHLPDFISAKDMHFQLSGMPMSKVMCAGMTLIVIGIAATVYGVFPPKKRTETPVAYELKSLDDAKLGWAHWQLVAVLGIALIVDVMKPATIGFVLPGLRKEYGISSTDASLLALFAMIGTTVGSIVWGMLADRLGRRGSILLASLMFVSTGICGTMPDFKWNLCMCFLMGMSAGGMLPIVFALLAEMTPARHRGWMSVLVGGLGTAGGYLAASGAAAALEPSFSWRILWLLNVPTGLLVIFLRNFIPESPRFLLKEGFIDEARKTLEKFNVALVPVTGATAPPPVATLPGFKQLFLKPYAISTLTVCFYGAAWGLVNWGFLTWLPTMLEDFMHMDRKIANHLLARAALFAAPACVLVAWLYGRWSSRKTLVLFAVLTAGVLIGFSRFHAGDSKMVFTVLTVLLLIGLSGMIAMLSPYSAELYPTSLRATGGGVAASSSKAGGIIGPSLVAFMLGISPGFMMPALFVAVPVLAAAVVLWFNGRETTGRRLEEIHQTPIRE